jgi:formylglycine-generating enzyme required for sulfatase activity
MVTLDPFFMSKYELTHGQWRRISSRIPDLPSAGIGELDDEEHLVNLEPAVQMSWNDCSEILPRLGLELPTEAQWEYAARAGTRTVWYTGDDMESIKGHANIRDRTAREQGLIMLARPYEDWLNDGFAKAAPVGSFEPNPFGIHDVIGNVYEWCRDWLVIYTSPVRAGDGERIPDIPDPKTRIVRSGSWDCVALATRTSFRVDSEPMRNDPGVGVRPSRRLHE